MNVALFRSLLRQALFLPVLALALVSGVLLWQMFALVDAIKKVDHSDQVTAALSRVLRYAVDEETGLRGYEVTGNPVFLEPYRSGEPAVESEFDRISDLIGNSSDRQAREQQSRLQQLRQAHAGWHEFAVQVLAMTPGGSDVRDSDFNLIGKSRMDHLRDVVAAMSDSESNRRSSYTQQVSWLSAKAILVAAGLTVAVGLLIGLFTRTRLKIVSKTYEELLKTQQEKVRELDEARTWLQTTLESIGDAVIICSPDEHVVFMNRVAEALCGWTMQEAVNRPLTEVFHIINEYSRDLVETPAAKVRRLNVVVGLANHTLLIRRDGLEQPIDDSGAPIHLPGGTMAGVVMVFRDISEQRKTQKALIANEKLALAGRLAASIAHEIHNPLDSVANLLYLIEHELQPSERARYLTLAQQEVGRIAHVSRTMLSLYREPRAPAQVDIKNLLDSVATLLSHKLRKLEVTVRSEIPAGITVEGFASELRQVFANLIGNAAEASPRGSEIQVSAEFAAANPVNSNGTGNRTGSQQLGRWVRIAVKDSGSGIPADLRNQLFQPFFTTKGEDGTGLGLWVSRGILEKHGGTIDFVSDTDSPKRGTTFTVVLPQSMATSAELPQIGART